MRTPLPVTIEVCVEGVDGLLVAQENGADRAELCAGLLEGGLTPSFGVVKAALRLARIPFHVIVRPRGGDFLYSATEFESMIDDVTVFRAAGVAGVVVGCLLPDGRIDEPWMGRLVAAAQPMSVTCHRAFDMTRDVEEAIESLARLGVDRVLTSGQRDTAMDGIETLARVVRATRGRLKIMACGGLDASNIAEVLKHSGADELHFAAPKTLASEMIFRNPDVAMGDATQSREFERSVTDPDAVRRTIIAARATRTP